MATTTRKTGVTDSAAGAGVEEFLGLSGPLAAQLQACGIIPIGDQWQIKGSLSHTPTVVSDTFPPSPIMAYRVPTGRALLFTGGTYHALGAATEYVRVCRRYFLFGYQATGAPAAPAAPTVALQAISGTESVGIASSGNFLYKIAPIDSFQLEGPLSVASSTMTLTSTNQCVTVTPPAAGTGVMGYNIYRTLAGGSTYYFIGTTPGATAFIDAMPDADVDTALTPNQLWVTGGIGKETMDGPGEVIIEVGGVALTGAPTKLIYKNADGRTRMVAVTWPTTIGARLRAKLFQETSNFIAVPTITANLWRAPNTIITDVRGAHNEDYGALGVAGVDTHPSAGCFMVWGQQVIGVAGRIEATAAIKATQIVPTNPHGVLIPPGGEIVVEIGAIAAGTASVRDVSLTGLLLPTTGT